MHELSIAQSLLEAAVAEAERAGAVRVTRIGCRIGAMCYVNAELLREAFEMLRGETVCAEAELEVAKSTLQAACPSCQHRFDVLDWNWQCPRCSSWAAAIAGGDELELTSIEAEVRK